MSAHADSFLAFLVEKYKSTGKTIFTAQEYIDFPNYQPAIDELVNRGLIVSNIDIYSTIEFSKMARETLNG